MDYLHTPAADQLFRTLMTLQSVDEYYALFEDLCTVKELKDMSLRLEVARLLSKGVRYQDVMQQTGISTATISRVNRCLQYGAGGYRLAISRMDPQDAETAGEQGTAEDSER